MFSNHIKKLLVQHQVWLTPFFIVLAAFIIRLIYLLQIESIPTFYNPIMDEQYHLHLVSLISNSNVPDESFYRAPLYPYLLAFFLKIVSGSLFKVRLIQITLGSFLPLLVYQLGLNVFTKRVAFISMVVAVFYPTFLYYDAALLITPIMVLLTTLFVIQLYRCQNYPNRILNFIVAGLLLGICGLARPNILLAGPMLIIWAWLILKPLEGPKKSIIKYALIGFASLLIILPVTLRNYQVSGDPVFIAWQGGYNFYLGNNRQASGWSATAPGIDQSWEGGYLQSIAIAEQAEQRRLTKSEVSDYWYDLAWEEIKKSPSDFIALQFKKLRLFINGYEIPNNQDIYISRKFAPILKPLMINKLIYFPYGLIVPFAIVGFIISLRNWRKYLLIYVVVFSYIISFQLFFVCARYRQPLIPLMILFAVFALMKLCEFFKQHHYKALGLSAIFLLVLFFESNHDLLKLSQPRVEAENRLMLGNAFVEQQNSNKAINEFKKAIEADSSYALPYNNLGMQLAQRGSTYEAIDLFQKAVAIDPLTVESFFNLATAYLETGKIDEAVKLLEYAARLHPYNDYVHLKLGMTYFEAGMITNAKNSVENSLRLNPSNPTSRQVYQQLQALPE